MRRVKRLWPAWASGLTWGVCFAGYTWLIPPDHSRISLHRLVVALVAGGLVGVAMGIAEAFAQRRKFQVDGDALTGAERVSVVNMVRGLAHTDDWRLHQAATRVAGRLVTRFNGPLVQVLAMTPGVVLLVVVSVWFSPWFWFLVAVFVGTAPLSIRRNLRRRAAARAYLATADQRGAPEPADMPLDIQKSG